MLRSIALYYVILYVVCIYEGLGFMVAIPIFTDISSSGVESVSF